MNTEEIKDLQKKLVLELIDKKFIKSKKVEEAFLNVPRHLFLPGEPLEKVYCNTAIVTKWDGKIPLSSSSEPAVYAIMLDQLQLKEGLKILEIGAGTGFNAALLANITGKKGGVVTVDIDKDITDSAQTNLNSAGFGYVKVICSDRRWDTNRKRLMTGLLLLPVYGILTANGSTS
jgi:protein-L-isoaspartate(D-aspartate) O-methyltransferase